MPYHISYEDVQINSNSKDLKLSEITLLIS